MVKHELSSSLHETTEPLHAPATATSLVSSTSAKVEHTPGMYSRTTSEATTPPNLPAPNSQFSSSIGNFTLSPTTTKTPKTHKKETPNPPTTTPKKSRTKTSQKSPIKLSTKRQYEGPSKNVKSEIEDSKKFRSKRSKSAALQKKKKKKSRKKEKAAAKREAGSSVLAAGSAGRERGREHTEERTPEEWLALAGVLKQRARAQRRGRNHPHVLSPHTIVPQYTFFNKRPRRSHEPVPTPMPTPLLIAKYQPICEQHTPTGEHPVTRAFKMRSAAPPLQGSPGAASSTPSRDSQSSLERRLRAPDGSLNHLRSKSPTPRSDTLSSLQQTDAGANQSSSSLASSRKAKTLSVTSVTSASSQQRSSAFFSKTSTCAASTSETNDATSQQQTPTSDPISPTPRQGSGIIRASSVSIMSFASAAASTLTSHFRNKKSNTSSLEKSSHMPSSADTSSSRGSLRHAKIPSKTVKQSPMLLITKRKSAMSNVSSPNFPESPQLLSSMHHIPFPMLNQSKEKRSPTLLYNLVRSSADSSSKFSSTSLSSKPKSYKIYSELLSSKTSSDRKSPSKSDSSELVTESSSKTPPTVRDTPSKLKNKNKLTAVLLESDTPGSGYVATSRTDSSDSGMSLGVSCLLQPSPRHGSRTHTTPISASGHLTPAEGSPLMTSTPDGDSLTRTSGTPSYLLSSPGANMATPQDALRPMDEEVVQSKFSVQQYPSPTYRRLAVARRLSPKRIRRRSATPSGVRRRQAAVDVGRLRWPVASPAPYMPGNELWEPCPTSPSYSAATLATPSASFYSPCPTATSFSASLSTSPAVCTSPARHGALVLHRGASTLSPYNSRPSARRLTNALKMLCCFFRPEPDDADDDVTSIRPASRKTRW